MENKQDLIVYLSTYPPRKCGIATFTQDLSSSVDKVYKGKIAHAIVALNRNDDSFDYNDNVIFQIDDSCIPDFIKIAEKINHDDRIKLVSIQHEFKIFGSDYGESLLIFLKALEKPVIMTFHSVLPAPSRYRKKIVQLLAEESNCIVVMNKLAVDILRKDYKLRDSRIAVIPHGIHDISFEANELVKEKLGYKDRLLITSFGFMRPGRGDRSSGKGYEYILEALPEIRKKFPNVLYLIAGVTHPNTIKKEGEKYRHSLMDEVRTLGLKKNVQFVNKYFQLNELLTLLKATDVYVFSGQNPNQITSGTLAYAMGCGRVVVSTPFLHAREIINEQRGFLAEFNDSKSFADAIIKVLSNSELKKEMENNAYEYTRRMTWENVGKSYKKIFDEFI